MKKIHFGFRMSTSILVLLPLITLSCFVQNAIAFAFKSSNSILGSRYFGTVENSLALHDNYSAFAYSTTKTYATSELDAELLSQGNEDAGDKVAKRRDNGRDYDDQGDYLKQTETTIRGIGGEGGLVYDVNKVKRNLVQEAVRAYKNELLYLLATPSVDLLLREYYDSEVQEGTSKLLPSTAAYIRSKDAANIESVIEEKLASLVRNNPVSTTTDSNLLEGTWEVAFMARNASKVLLWQPSYLSDRSVVRQSDDWQNTHSSIGTGQTVSPLQSFTRTYHLENVDADQDAYVVDCNRRLGRLFMVSERTYTVSRLTRTSLELTLSSSSRRMLSSLFHVERDWNEEDNEKIQFNGEKDISTLSATAASKHSKRPKTLNVQILYLDSDLCVCVERFVDQDDSRPRGTSKSSSFDGKLVVYTKSKVWTGRKERFDRTVRQTLAPEYAPSCLFVLYYHLCFTFRNGF